jgi:plastocyanin
MTSRWGKLLLLVVSVALMGAACSSKKAATTSTTSSEGGKVTIGSEQANDHGKQDLSGKDETEVEVDSFYFEPTVMQGTAGQQIKLELSNESKTLHNFSLEGGSADQDIQPGERQDVTVTFPQSGTMVFFCKYHRSSGMLGELEVAS